MTYRTQNRKACQSYTWIRLWIITKCHSDSTASVFVAHPRWRIRPRAAFVSRRFARVISGTFWQQRAVTKMLICSECIISSGFLLTFPEPRVVHVPAQDVIALFLGAVSWHHYLLLSPLYKQYQYFCVCLENKKNISVGDVRNAQQVDKSGLPELFWPNASHSFQWLVSIK